MVVDAHGDCVSETIIKWNRALSAIMSNYSGNPNTSHGVAGDRGYRLHGGFGNGQA